MELFAGCGGLSAGLESAGMQVKCINFTFSVFVKVSPPPPPPPQNGDCQIMVTQLNI